ncbi:MAG: hypothetical protein ABR509_05465 [Candidatus Limnocylindria bacterium]
MTSRHVPESDGDLARELRALGAAIAFPTTPPLAAAVAARLRAPAPTPRGPRWLGGRSMVRAFALAVMGLLVLAAAAAAIRWGLGGVNFRFTDETASPLASSVRSSLSYGDETTLREAEARVGFEVLLPALEELGQPDAVFVTRVPASGGVALAYGARPGFPVDNRTGVGLLLTEVRLGMGPETFEKLIHQGVRVDNVTVNGTPAYWIAGGTHVLIYRDSQGGEVAEETRLVGDTLLWEEAGLTLRLENAPSLSDALRVAESAR